MKKSPLLFVLWVLLFFAAEILFSIALLAVASLIAQARFAKGEPLWLASLLCVVLASYILMALATYMMRYGGCEKAYARFSSLYWLYAFIALVIAVFFSADVLPRFYWISFVDGKGFDYVASYLAFAILSGVLPRILLFKIKKGGLVDGGNI